MRYTPLLAPVEKAHLSEDTKEALRDLDIELFGEVIPYLYRTNTDPDLGLILPKGIRLEIRQYLGQFKTSEFMLREMHASILSKGIEFDHDERISNPDFAEYYRDAVREHIFKEICKEHDAEEVNDGLDYIIANMPILKPYADISLSFNISANDLLGKDPSEAEIKAITDLKYNPEFMAQCREVAEYRVKELAEIHFKNAANSNALCKVMSNDTDIENPIHVTIDLSLSGEKVFGKEPSSEQMAALEAFSAAISSASGACPDAEKTYIRKAQSELGIC